MMTGEQAAVELRMARYIRWESEYAQLRGFGSTLCVMSSGQHVDA